MTKTKILAAAAILAAALASPAMAQQFVVEPGTCAQFDPNGNCQARGPGHPYARSDERQIYQEQAYRDQPYQRRAWRDSYNRWDDDRGMGPGGVAASAPIGGEEYARRNGFVCLPGTWFRGEDARMHICQ
jgi:opacity protein-like surface antigen